MLLLYHIKKAAKLPAASREHRVDRKHFIVHCVELSERERVRPHARLVKDDIDAMLTHDRV